MVGLYELDMCMEHMGGIHVSPRAWQPWARPVAVCSQKENNAPATFLFLPTQIRQNVRHFVYILAGKCFL